MREAHLESPESLMSLCILKNRLSIFVQKYRFFNELQLTFSVDITRYCPGRQQVTTVCIFKVKESRPEFEIFTQGGRFLQRITSNFN